MASSSVQSPQLLTAAATAGSTVPRTSLLGAMVANVGAAAFSIQETQISALVPVESGDQRSVPRVTSLPVMVAYSTDIREDNTQRAWTFDLDGHTFYVLALGTQGTWVFDLVTQQWARWDTAGYPIWNAELGHVWDKQSRIIAADFQTPQIFEVDPTAFIDENFRPMTRTVTGFLEVRGRNGVSCDALYLQASAGAPQADAPTMTLSMSDDQGQTFFDFDTVLVPNDNTDQFFDWRSLGTIGAPGRVFKVTDFGGPLRISGADVMVGG